MLNKLRGKIKEVLRVKSEEGPSVPNSARSPTRALPQGGSPSLSRRASQVDYLEPRRRRRNHNSKIKLSEEMMGKVLKRAQAGQPARTAGLLSPVSASRAVVVSQQQAPEIEELVESYVEVVCDEDFTKKGKTGSLAPSGLACRIRS
jgi:hypothetical protein